jgi:energy-coupling factor transport system permease protein
MTVSLSFDASRRGWLAAVDPRAKIVWVASLSLASVLVDSTAALVALLIISAVGAAGLRLSLRGWLALGGLLVAFAWSAIVTQALFYAGEPRTPIFTLLPPLELFSLPGAERSTVIRFPGIIFYEEGALYGLKQSLRGLSLSIAGLSTVLSTSPQRLLSALVRLGLPGGLAFMTTAALRFLPSMIDEWATVRRARWLRGYRGGKSWRTRIQGELGVLLPVLAAALRRAARLATSVTSRGFSATARRTFYPELQMSARERVATAGMIIAVVSLSLVKTSGWLAVWYGSPPSAWPVWINALL